MNIKQKTGMAVGAAVIGVGAVLGVGYAVAGTSSQAQPQATQAADGSAPGGGAPGGGAPDGGQGGGQGGRDGSRGMSNLAASLAEKLGLDETTVADALQEVMQANRPDGTGGNDQGTPPSAGAQPTEGGQPGGDRTERDAAIAKALAAKLGVDEAKVTAALAEIRAEQQANQPGDAGRDGGDQTAQPSPSASA